MTSSAVKAAGRTLLWIGASASAGACLVALTEVLGSIIFAWLSPFSGYGDSPSPAISMETFDVVAPLLTGFLASMTFLGVCLLARLPLHRVFVAMAIGFGSILAWTTAISGAETAVLTGALGIMAGCAVVGGVRRLTMHSARPSASA